MSFYPGSGGSGGGLQPWQFQPESYGAKGDGKVGNGGSGSSGSAAFSDAGASFTAADKGKAIMINGGSGATNAPLITTIASVNSATSVTLGATLGANVSSGQYIYGTDDTAAFVSCVAAASNFAQGISGGGTGFGNFYAQIFLASKYYCLASGPTQTGNGSSIPTFNSQIALPYPNANGATQKLVLEFFSEGDGSQCQYFESTIVNLQSACLVSMVAAPASGGSVTFGAQSVIGGPTGSSGFTGGFANVKAMLTGITVVTGALTQQMGADFRFCGGAHVDKCGFQAFASVLGNSPTLGSLISNATFTSGNSTGLYMPVVTNNDDCNVGVLSVEGFSFGVAFNEHFTATRLALIYCNSGAFLNPSGSPIHGFSILYMSCEASNTALQISTAASGQVPCFIGLMDNEAITNFDVVDPSNDLIGLINWAAFDQATPRISAAANVTIVSRRLASGHMASPPAVPLTTVASTPVFRPASVVVHTGVGVTVSAISVNGTATGLTMAASSSLALPGVPSGGTVTLTYAGGTPTWDWWLSG